MKIKSRTDEKIHLRTINRVLWRKIITMSVFITITKNDCDPKRYRLLI
jgi:hypothetical protein